MEDKKVLMTVSDMNEANIIKARLESFGIPTVVLTKSPGDAGHVYMNKSISGYDVIIRESDYVEAKNIIDMQYNEEELNHIIDALNLQEDDSEHKAMFDRRKKFMVWILIFVFGIPILFYLFTQLHMFAELFTK
ncbi:putative signal transducing protein [Vallitalea okinawensis]|uniref:DUF2007 domain-containing protein n=1 Tax=Vallitalea okinawensis TaxID=2078660 RepID=UPI000CFDC8D8|nr:DUF2007 domain-containing protein [Vallitalea okinawensis]